MAAPNTYQGPQILPQLAPPQQQHGEGPPAGAGFNNLPGRQPPAGQGNGPNGTPASNGGPAGSQGPQYSRPFTPPTEIRPIREERPTSPGSAYSHPPYHHGAGAVVQGNGGIASGAPPPAAAVAAAEAAARERDERPSSSMKRAREWESESVPVKKIANEENRARLEDQSARRVSPSRIPSPRDVRRRSSSEVRREDQRRTHDSYHPSEAAHHPPTLPSIQHMQPQQGPKMPPMAEGPAPIQGNTLASLPPALSSAPAMPPKEERDRNESAAQHEPPARKMDVDEDYDDDGDEEKKASAGKAGSPKGNGTSTGIVNGGSQSSQTKAETSG